MASLMKAAGSPIAWVLSLLLLGLLLAKFPRKKPHSRLGWLVVLLGTLMLYLFSTVPIANLLVYTLEYRQSHPSSEAIEALDIMVILGGGTYPSNGFRERAGVKGDSLARLVGGAKIFKESGVKALAVCGGGQIETGETGGQIMRDVLIELGIEPESIIAEGKSANTMQNATELKEILGPSETRHIGLVTSATHMSRSIGVFKKVFPEDVIVAVPVDYVYIPPVWDFRIVIPSEKALQKSARAIHEWIGMLWYCVRY